MTPITTEKLRHFAPNGSPALLKAIASEAGLRTLNSYGINTPRRLQHFLAQIAHETGGLRRLEENMNYTADRMMEVFGPRRVKGKMVPGRNGLTRSKAEELDELGPKAIANFLYGGEWGRVNLGNTQDGDGWLYRGSGPMQETGRANFARRAKETGLPLVTQPDLMRQPAGAIEVAAASWRARGCNELADRDDLKGVTRRINPALLNLDDRQEWLDRAKEFFRDADVPSSSPTAVDRAIHPPLIMSADATSDSLRLDTAKALGEATPGGDGYVYFKPASQVDEALKAIQTKMDAGGYPGVGQLDGKWGTKTYGALARLAAANSFTGFPWKEGEPPRMPEALYRAIGTGNFVQPKKSESREAATTADMLEDAPRTMGPIVAQSKATGWSAFLLFLSGIGASLMQYFDVALDWFRKVEEYLPKSPGALALCFAVILGLCWFGNRLIKMGAKADYRDEKIN